VAGQRPSALYRVARSAQMVSRTPCAPGSSGISRTPRAGSFHSAITREASRPWGRERSTIPYEVSVSTAEPGSSARTLAYLAVQREVSCGPSSSTLKTSVGPNRPDELSDLVIVGQVLAHERGQHELGDFHELDCLAGHVHGFPPADVGVKGAAEVVLLHLGCIQQPAMVLVLADVKPRFVLLAREQPTFLELRVEAQMQPVARESARLPGGLAHPRHKSDDAMSV